MQWCRLYHILYTCHGVIESGDSCHPFQVMVSVVGWPPHPITILISILGWSSRILRSLGTWRRRRQFPPKSY